MRSYDRSPAALDELLLPIVTAAAELVDVPPDDDAMNGAEPQLAGLDAAGAGVVSTWPCHGAGRAGAVAAAAAVSTVTGEKALATSQLVPKPMSLRRG